MKTATIYDSANGGELLTGGLATCEQSDEALCQPSGWPSHIIVDNTNTRLDEVSPYLSASSTSMRTMADVLRRAAFGDDS